MKAWLVCPNCLTSEHLATGETMIGIAPIRVTEEEGQVEYTTGTEVDWDSQVTVLDAQGRPLLFCRACCQEFGYPGRLEAI